MQLFWVAIFWGDGLGMPKLGRAKQILLQKDKEHAPVIGTCVCVCVSVCRCLSGCGCVSVCLCICTQVSLCLCLCCCAALCCGVLRCVVWCCLVVWCGFVFAQRARGSAATAANYKEFRLQSCLNIVRQDWPSSSGTPTANLATAR